LGCTGSSRLGPEASKAAPWSEKRGELVNSLMRVAADLRAFYRDLYTVEDAERAQFLGGWRALGAQNKAAHIQALCFRAGIKPRRLVEIGCGDGALLAALSSRKLGARLDGFELSAEAAELARDKRIPNAERIEAYDGEHVPAANDAYDLAILSHVVEHVPEAEPLLREAARLAAYVIVEVPLEDNLSARRPAVRAAAARIGHVHAFNRQAVRRLLERADLTVVEELTDPLSLAHHTYFAANLPAQVKAAAKTFVRRSLFRVSSRWAERLFTVHYACLAARAG
jgi:SAM-dependent methyltransferase